MDKKYLFTVVFLFFLSTVSSVSIYNTNLNTSISNSSITFSVQLNMSSLNINSTQIDLYDVECPFGLINFTWKDINSNKNSNEICVSPSGTGGGGGTGYETNINFLCNQTYFYIQQYGTNKSFVENFSKEILNKNGIIYGEATVKSYIDNWQLYCSDLLKKTLKEELVCNKIYNELIDNNLSLNAIERGELRDKLKIDIVISNNLLNIYIDNFNEKCSKYTPSFPIEKIEDIIEKIFPEVPSCNTILDVRFLGMSMDWSFPFFKKTVDCSCSSIDNWRWFFRIIIDKDNCYINGIKAWWVISLLIILFIILWICILLYHQKTMDRIRANAVKIKKLIIKKWKELSNSQ